MLGLPLQQGLHMLEKYRCLASKASNGAIQCVINIERGDFKKPSTVMSP